MKLRQLRYFVTIVDAGSFSRAAHVAHLAQPALSQQIADLEEQLGVTLLQRSARGVNATAAGQRLYGEAVRFCGASNACLKSYLDRTKKSKAACTSAWLLLWHRSSRGRSWRHAALRCQRCD
jgi:DNA-binding transcriptional LysR family regulator